MRKVLLVLFAFLIVCSFSSGASALNFTLNSYDVNLNDSDPGLKLDWAPILGTPISADFEVGDTLAGVPLFKIWADESAVNNDDKVPQPISVDFGFSSPEIFGGAVTGSTYGVTGGFKGFFQKGAVAWDGPVQLAFGPGDTGLFEISLSDAYFNKGIFWGLGCRGATIYADFTYVQASVPEPGTIALLLCGLAVL